MTKTEILRAVYNKEVINSTPNKISYEHWLERELIHTQEQVKNLNIVDVSKSFYCETKRGCLEQCDDCALTELAKDMAC